MGLLRSRGSDSLPLANPSLRFCSAFHPHWRACVAAFATAASVFRLLWLGSPFDEPLFVEPAVLARAKRPFEMDSALLRIEPVLLLIELLKEGDEGVVAPSSLAADSFEEAVPRRG